MMVGFGKIEKWPKKVGKWPLLRDKSGQKNCKNFVKNWQKRAKNGQKRPFLGYFWPFFDGKNFSAHFAHFFYQLFRKINIFYIIDKKGQKSGQSGQKGFWSIFDVIWTIGYF